MIQNEAVEGVLHLGSRREDEARKKVQHVVMLLKYQR
jgi:hypothetical protein